MGLGLKAAAENPNVWCKLSGMITEASHTGWTADDLAPYVHTTLAAFGLERVMYGSDWPVCTLAGSYEQADRRAPGCAGRATRAPSHSSSAAQR